MVAPERVSVSRLRTAALRLLVIVTAVLAVYTDLTAAAKVVLDSVNTWSESGVR